MNIPSQILHQYETQINLAQAHLKSLLDLVFCHTQNEKAVVVYDTKCLLSTILAAAYHKALPQATFIDFDTQTPENIHTVLDILEEGDFVALVQSKSFRLNQFRIRIELFKRKIKVIEHPHLSRMAESETEAYVDSLEYDFDYYRGVGHALKEKLDTAPFGILKSGDETLNFEVPFESAKLNIGDYSQMNNIGGQYPLGEVFTESTDLKAVNGRVNIFSFGDVTYKLNYPETPITLIIKEGQVIATENSNPAFDEILFNIRRDEGGVVWVRELGLGMNRAFSKTRTVADTGTYERMCGIHLSIGAKHGIYAKPGFKRRDGRYHVDIFVDTDTFTLGEETIFEKGAWKV